MFSSILKTEEEIFVTMFWWNIRKNKVEIGTKRRVGGVGKLVSDDDKVECAP